MNCRDVRAHVIIYYRDKERLRGMVCLSDRIKIKCYHKHSSVVYLFIQNLKGNATDNTPLLLTVPTLLYYS